MTNVNITEDTYQVTVTEGATQVVTVKAPGPQGPGFPDGNLGDVTSSNTGTTVTVNAGAINNAKVASDAAIAGTKINPSFGNQNVVTGGNLTVNGGQVTINGSTAAIDFSDNEDNPDYRLVNSNGIFKIRDKTSAVDRIKINTDGHVDFSNNVDFLAGVDVTGNITVTGTVDGRDVAADGTKLDGIETGATADQTAAEIKTLLDSNGIVNSNVDASAAIAGTKISPDFGSQDIDTTGKIKITGSGGNNSSLNITNAHDSTFFSFTDNSNNSDFNITYAGTGGAEIKLQHDGTVQLAYGGALRLKTQSQGVNVQGNITVTGTVDGRDLQTDGTKLDGIEANAINASNTAITNKLPLAGGTLTGDLIISNNSPKLTFVDNNHNPDYQIGNADGLFRIRNTTAASNKLTINSSGLVTVTNDLTVGGNFTVNGTTTTIDTTTLTVEDKNIELGKVTTPTDTTADGGGLTLKGATDKTFQWLDATDSWTSSEHIALGDNKKIRLGNSQDLELYHDSSHSFILNNTGNLYVDNSAGVNTVIQAGNDIFLRPQGSESGVSVIGNGAVELYYDNSKKLETTSTGATVTGSLTISSTTPEIFFTDTNNNSDFKAYVENGTFHIMDVTSTENRFRIESDGDFDLKGNVRIPLDNKKLTLGASADLEIYHSGSQSYVREVGTGNLILQGSAGVYIGGINNEYGLVFIEDAGVELRYDNSKKFETTSGGVKVSGNLEADQVKVGDNETIRIGDNSDILLLHDANGSVHGVANSSYIKCQGVHDNILNIFTASASGKIHLKSNNLAKTMLSANGNGSVDLYHNNSKKFETTSTGITAFGTEHKFTSSGVGDCIVILEADTDNNNEADNPKLIFKQDGGVEAGSIGLNFTNSSSFPSNEFYIAAGNNQHGMGFYTTTSTGFSNGTKKLEITPEGNILIPNDSTGSTVGRLQIGASQDLQLWHTGTDSFVHHQTGSGVLRLNTAAGGEVHITKSGPEYMGKFIPDDAVELYYDNSKKFETTSTGVKGSGTQNVFGSGGDLTTHNGNRQRLAIIGNSSDGSMLHIRGGSPAIFFDQSGGNTPKIYQDNNNLEFYAGTPATEGINVLLLQPSGNVRIPNDNAKLQLGASQDLDIWHSGSHSYIQNTTGNLFIHSNELVLRSTSQEMFIDCSVNGSVDLYYDNSKKLETQTNGARIYDSLGIGANSTSGALVYLRTPDGSSGNNTTKKGIIIRDGAFSDGALIDCQDSTGTTFFSVDGDLSVNLTDNRKLQFGDSQDCTIQHDGSRTMIRQHGIGSFVIDLLTSANTFAIRKSNLSETIARFIPDGANELYFDNSKKFETTSTGTRTTGISVVGANAVGMGSLNAATQFVVTNLSGNNNSVDLTILGGRTGKSAVVFGDHDDVSVGAITYDHDNESIIFTNNNSNTNKLVITSGGNIQMPNDNARLQIGDSQDLELYHSSNNSIINNSASGYLFLQSNNLALRSIGQENMILGTANGSVDLYFDASKKLETTSTGATVTTTSAANSIKNITTSTSAPSGGSDGDLWFTYIA